jgi:hypothetical protein
MYDRIHPVPWPFTHPTAASSVVLWSPVSRAVHERVLMVVQVPPRAALARPSYVYGIHVFLLTCMLIHMASPGSSHTTLLYTCILIHVFPLTICMAAYISSPGTSHAPLPQAVSCCEAPSHVCMRECSWSCRSHPGPPLPEPSYVYVIHVSLLTCMLIHM